MRRAMHGIDEILQLDRIPPDERDQLFAFDAADELLVTHLQHASLLCTRPWILNDRFGALSLALARYEPWCITETVLTKHGIEHNGRLNGSHVDLIQCRLPNDYPTDTTELVVMRVPKSKALLRHQLSEIRPCLRNGSMVVAGAMVKHLPRDTKDEFERYIGPSTTTKAVKKARLVIAQHAARTITPAPITPYKVPETSIEIQSQAGVFGGGQLDHGAALLLRHLVMPPTCQTAIDLGCGDGVLGVTLGVRSPRLKVRFSDISYRALECAERNWIQHRLDPKRAEFVAEESGQHAVLDSADLVVCNPPFHDAHARTDATAWRMFSRARAVLRQGGQFIVVGNRHLSYHGKLKRLFGNCRVLGSDSKFVVLEAIKP